MALEGEEYVVLKAEAAWNWIPSNIASAWGSGRKRTGQNWHQKATTTFYDSTARRM
jgi:hypothetical protein